MATKMINRSQFFKLVLNTITEHIAVIDQHGGIQYVNTSWKDFGRNNFCRIKGNWIGVNYLAECDAAAALGDDFGVTAGAGIREVIAGDKPQFYLEYPCHSPDEKRWFMMRVTPFSIEESRCFVISHQNITERKIAEEKVLNLARIDGLTDIPNRRYFDEFLGNEWKRCARAKVPLSLALIDLDHFKLLNDTYGHQAGDEALIRVASLLKDFARRPADLCARYGGEEFAIIWAETAHEQAAYFAEKLLQLISNLNIANEKSPAKGRLTASIGLATLFPEHNSEESSLIAAADKLLYKAKKNGRDCIEHNGSAYA